MIVLYFIVLNLIINVKVSKNRKDNLYITGYEALLLGLAYLINYFIENIL